MLYGALGASAALPDHLALHPAMLTCSIARAGACLRYLKKLTLQRGDDLKILKL